MRKLSDEQRSVEEFNKFREALRQAVTPEEDMQPNEDQPSSLDELPDDHRLGLTDSMMLHAGLGLSGLGVTIGIESPSSLEQLHQRGETFLYGTLGAAALYAAYGASQQLL